jgi:hypothetical protein
MRAPYEFTFHTVKPNLAALAEGDPTLDLLGMQGWEMRGVTTLPDGTVLVALQRRLDDETELPSAPQISAALLEPLSAPPLDDAAP